MRALITGGAGFIGSNFVHLLREQRPEWDLVVLDKLTYAGNLENLEEILKSDEVLKSGRVKFVRGDILDAPLVRSLWQEQPFDYVIHFAAESHVDRSIMSAIPFVQTNVVGTQTLLDVALEFKHGRFLHVSTDEVYGSLGPTGQFYETTPLDPSSPYSASKAGSDLMVHAAHKTHGLDAMITRCTNNYGPYHFPEKLIPLFITNALEDRQLPLYGDGMNVRSWLHVKDHCEALLAVAERGRAGEVYNIGGGADGEIPNRDVTYALLEILKKPESLIKHVPDRPGHDRRYSVDITKISSELGWTPRTKFREGLEDTVRWYRDNERWWRRVKSGDYLEYYERNYAHRGKER